MPNWCENYITVIGFKKSTDKLFDDIQKLNGKGDGVFQHLIGLDDDYNEDNWYDHNVNRFGTKWDVDYHDLNLEYTDDGPMGRITMSPMTAWSPPLPFAKLLSDKYGVTVEVVYQEPGNDFSGKYTAFGDGTDEINEYDTYDEGLYYNDNDYFWENITQNTFEYYYDSEISTDEVVSNYPFLNEKEKIELTNLWEEYVSEREGQSG